MTRQFARSALAWAAAILIAGGSAVAFAAGGGGSGGGGSGGGGAGGGGGGGRGAPSPTSVAGKDFSRAVELIEAQDYDAAIPLLKQVVASNPESADAWNYLGFSHRRLRQYETALGYYEKALAIDPEHLGANEYMGELYLEMGDLKKAEERLDVLDDACFFGCDPYYELKEAVTAYKAKNGG